jgi:hypothetical protein
MSIEIDINKFPEYPEISKLLDDILKDNEMLRECLKKISTLNSLGKTLQIEEIIIKALNE